MGPEQLDAAAHQEWSPDRTLDPRTAVPRVRASWRRCESYGVPHDRVLPAFAGTPPTHSLFHECARTVLEDLHADLGGEPVSLMVADADGLVLDRICDDAGMRRSLDAVHLAPGFSYAERFVGTNGLGLSLADRAPSLVRAEDHYTEQLRGYTCAAAPVLLRPTGEVAGTINLTTWARSSPQLLLALARAAAGATAALMQARGGGRAGGAAPRAEASPAVGEPRVLAYEDPCRSRPWSAALDAAAGAVAAGRLLAVVGEPGAGKSTLAALALHRVRRRHVLYARTPPLSGDVAPWLELWLPALAAGTADLVVSRVEALPAWAGERLALLLAAVRSGAAGPCPVVLAAASYAALPESLAPLVDAVVEAPALRERPADVLPLAGLFARQERRRPIAFAPRAVRALAEHGWPGNAAQLRDVVREAARRTDVVDAQHLPAEVFADGRRVLTRLEALERDEIVSCLAEPGTTVAQAAERLGIGRATVYRKLVQYGIRVPRER